jgi:hypothetical protein
MKSDFNYNDFPATFAHCFREQCLRNICHCSYIIYAIAIAQYMPKK